MESCLACRDRRREEGHPHRRGTAPAPAPPAGSRTRRSPSISSTPGHGDTRPWTGRCTPHARGPRTRTAVGRPGWPRTLSSRPSRNWPGQWSNGSWTPDTASAGELPKRAWRKLSAGPGAKGHRYYDWAVIDLTDPAPGHRRLLIRRNRTTGELAYHRCHSTRPVPLSTLVGTAGSRWRVEESFQTAKGLEGLDEHQVRRYPSWSRRGTLALLAHASSPSSAQTSTLGAPDRTTWPR